MRKTLCAALLAAACLLMQGPPTFAQGGNSATVAPSSAGQISGLLTDPTGAVLAGARVELRNLTTGHKQRLISDSFGRFEFLLLPSGVYQLTVTANGFALAIVRDLAVRSGQATPTDLTLKLATATTTVQVDGQEFRLLGTSSQKVDADARGFNRNTAEVVATAPGASLRDNGAQASIPMLHGLGDERTRIVVDGMTVTSSCPNHMNPPLSYIAPAQAAQVTIIAGITPVSLGGDSLGGTVSVESRLPVFASADDKLHEEGSANGFYHSNSNGYGGSVSEWLAGKNFGIGYTGVWATIDNYTDGAEHKVTSTYAQSTDHTVTLAAQGKGNLLTLQAGLHHTPYEGFVSAQMDMVRNYASSLNLSYRRAIGRGTLDAHVYGQNAFHEMNIGHDKSTFPMPMHMPMNTHGRDVGYSMHYDLPVLGRHTRE
jgi:iron complex outermembrane receptor protein